MLRKITKLTIIILIISLLIILVACKKDEVDLKKIKKTTAKKTVKASTRSVEKEVQKSESDFLTTPEIDQTYQANNIQTQTPDTNYQQQTQDQSTYSQGYDTTIPYDVSQDIDTSIQQTTQAPVKKQVGGCPLGSDPACENRNPGDRCATPYLSRGGYCRIPKGGATTCTCMAKMTEKMSMY